ncbi:MAG TPA: hypothetical protein VGE07_15095 [Herpetosiphonaceae bacterium]
MLDLQPTHREALPAALAQQRLVSMTVGPTQRLTFLSASHAAQAAGDVSGYDCTVIDHRGATTIPLPRHPRLSWCHELPGQRFLVGCTRGHPARPNGQIINAAGQVEREIFLGDGISSLQVAPSGTIWLGYFDEGLFGNAGWLHPTGGVGFVALDDQGQVVYQTPLPFTTSPMPVDDCRVTVVSDTEVWYAYEHRWRARYPVVVIEREQVRHVGDWTEAGYWYLAVGTEYVLAVNVFSQPHGLHVFARMPSDPWRPLQACTLRDTAGHPINGVTYAARGSMLWVLTEGWAYGIDVNAIRLP